MKNHFAADYYSIPVPSWEVFQQTHEKIISLSEGPLPGPNVVYHFNIYTFAKNIGIKIMLSGQGADELFMGYPGFVKSYWAELYTGKKFKNLDVFFIRIIRPSNINNDLHSSETEYMKIPCDIEIINDGSIKDYINKFEAIIH